MLQKLRSFFGGRPPPLPLQGPPGQLLQVGGRLLDSREWSPEVIEKLKAEFFMPSLKNAFLIRMDITGSCPEQHLTTERVGIFCNKTDIAKKVSEDLNKMRISLMCKECGKPSKVSGRRVAWQGPLSEWDGAT